MGRFVIRRLIGMVAVLFAISVIVFLIFNVIPNSDPAARIAGEKSAGNAQLIANINEEWGFDESLPAQYVSMMEKVFTGELVSYETHSDVVDEIVAGLPATLSLCIGAAILWMSVALLFGYLSAVQAGGWSDRLLTILALIGISMPVFWLAGLLLIYLTFKVEIFPSTNTWPDRRTVRMGHPPDPALDHARHPLRRLLQPSPALEHARHDERGLGRTARAKGLSERQVRTRHVLRNSLIPIVTLFGLDFGAMLGGGAILTEALFGLKGVGNYAAEAMETLDLPPLMAVTLFGAFFIVFFNALVDIAYAKLDPRVRLGESANG